MTLRPFQRCHVTYKHFSTPVCIRTRQRNTIHSEGPFWYNHNTSLVRFRTDKRGFQATFQHRIFDGAELDNIIARVGVVRAFLSLHKLVKTLRTKHQLIRRANASKKVIVDVMRHGEVGMCGSGALYHIRHLRAHERLTWTV